MISQITYPLSTGPAASFMQIVMLSKKKLNWKLNSKYCIYLYTFDDKHDINLNLVTMIR